MGRDPQYICPVIVDPSAASFIAELQRRGVYVIAGGPSSPYRHFGRQVFT